MHIDLPVTVDTEGQISDVSFPPHVDPSLAERLRERMREWSFEPARIGDRSVTSRTHLAIDLRIEPQADGDFAVHVDEVSSGPKALRRSGIRYPMEALMARSQGAVLVRMTVNPDGSVSNVRGEMAGRAHKSLIRAAERAVEGWRFEPDQAEGVRIATDTTATIRFCMQLHRQTCSEIWAAERAERERRSREQGAPVRSGRVPTTDVVAQRIDSSDGGSRSRGGARGNIRIKGR